MEVDGKYLKKEKKPVLERKRQRTNDLKLRQDQSSACKRGKHKTTQKQQETGGTFCFRDDNLFIAFHRPWKRRGIIISKLTCYSEKNERQENKIKTRKEIKNDTKIVQERSQQEMYSQISKAKKCNLLIKQRIFLQFRKPMIEKNQNQESKPNSWNCAEIFQVCRRFGSILFLVQFAIASIIETYDVAKQGNPQFYWG